MFKHELGAKVKDLITGFEGIITSRSEHITGCNTYWVNPGIDKKTNKMEEGLWLDENRLVVTGKAIKIPVSPDPKLNGATYQAPPRNG